MNATAERNAEIAATLQRIKDHLASVGYRTRDVRAGRSFEVHGARGTLGVGADARPVLGEVRAYCVGEVEVLMHHATRVGRYKVDETLPRRVEKRVRRYSHERADVHAANAYKRQRNERIKANLLALVAEAGFEVDPEETWTWEGRSADVVALVGERRVKVTVWDEYGKHPTYHVDRLRDLRWDQARRVLEVLAS